MAVTSSQCFASKTCYTAEWCLFCRDMTIVSWPNIAEAAEACSAFFVLIHGLLFCIAYFIAFTTPSSHLSAWKNSMSLLFFDRSHLRGQWAKQGIHPLDCRVQVGGVMTINSCRKEFTCRQYFSIAKQKISLLG